MHTLADEVVEFTMTLVRAFNRVANFDPKSPNFPRLRARLYKDLTRLQRTQPEIGYIVGPPAAAGGPNEIHVDGTGPQRTELRRIVGPSIGGAFALQLLEFMQRRSILILAFQKGIAEAEWNGFLEIVTAPPEKTDPAEEGERVCKQLVERKVTRIAIVRNSEQFAEDPSLQWPIRIALTRLGSDVRAGLATGDLKPDAILDSSARLAAGMAYSLFRRFELLRALLWDAPKLDPLMRKLPALKTFSARDIVVRGLPPLALAGTTKLILRDAGPEDKTPEEPAMSVLRSITERLLLEPPAPKTDEVLREMCRRQVVPITRLPVELQEWVLAEIWVDELRAQPSKLPPAGAGINSVRLLQKAMRYSLAKHRFVEANDILMRLRTADAKAIPGVFDEPTAEALLAGFPDDPMGRRGIVELLAEGADAAADSVAAVVAQGTEKLCEAGAWILTEMKARGVAAALRALDKEIDSEEAAHLLIACVAGRAGNDAAPILAKQLKHASPKVRRSALSALAEADPKAAEPHVAQALSDEDESVRIRALLLCANTGVGSEKVIPQALKLVSRDARGASAQVVRAAIEVVVRRRQAGMLAAVDAEDALCRLAKPIGFFGKLLGQLPPPGDVLVTATAALGRLGSARTHKLLKTLSRSKDPDVRRAAGEALSGASSKSGATPRGTGQFPSGEYQRSTGSIKK